MGSQIIGFIGLLTIVISCLGLLGMVIYATESRIKEVGIRKVLGASAANIVWKLSKGFLFLLGIAVLIGLPLTLLISNLWLQNFFLRIQIGVWIPLSGIGVLLALGLLTVLSQTYLAAQRNPVESLRD
jgi:putative ABC transport system permease protein